MSAFAVVAARATPTNARLGSVLTPAQAVAHLRPGDIALGRIDVRPSLDGVEPGLWALNVLARRGITVLNGSAALATAHDKLATAVALERAGVPHPKTFHVAPWLPRPLLDAPLVLKPRFGSWGRDVTRCNSQLDLDDALDQARLRVWFNATGGVVQELVEPYGYDLRVLVAGGRVVGSVLRHAAPGEWRTNVELGARRVPVSAPENACELALAAAEAIGGALVGVDLMPVPPAGWIVLEVNGAVDFNWSYLAGADVFAEVQAALLGGVRYASDAQLPSRARNGGLPQLRGGLREHGGADTLAAG